MKKGLVIISTWKDKYGRLKYGIQSNHGAITVYDACTISDMQQYAEDMIEILKVQDKVDIQVVVELEKELKS